MAFGLTIAAFGLAVFAWMVWPALDSKRWRFATDLSLESMFWGAISVGLLAFFFQDDLAMAPIFVVAILVHEYGHVLAFRLAGHRAPRFRLVPFGGVAISDEPPKTQAENAYIALMGPGFSVVLLIVAVAGMPLLIVSGDTQGAALMAKAVFAISALNAFNLLPFYPLDGGKALRAVAMTIGKGAAAAMTILMSVAFAGFALAIGSGILLFFAAIGLLGALRASEWDENAETMSTGACVLVFLTYIAVFAVHGYALFEFLFVISAAAA